MVHYIHVTLDYYFYISVAYRGGIVPHYDKIYVNSYLTIVAQKILNPALTLWHLKEA